MSAQRSGHGSAAVDSPPDGSPSPTSLSALATLGMLAALWALFLWAELVVARSGGASFCPFGESANCAAGWNDEFAEAVQRLTGLPVAGWGLAWSLVAFALPVFALRRSALRRPRPSLFSAIRLTGHGRGRGGPPPDGRERSGGGLLLGVPSKRTC